MQLEISQIRRFKVYKNFNNRTLVVTGYKVRNLDVNLKQKQYFYLIYKFVFTGIVTAGCSLPNSVTNKHSFYNKNRKKITGLRKHCVNYNLS